MSSYKSLHSYIKAGRNYLINGNFDIWQRGITQTVSGYGSDDKWFNGIDFSEAIFSRQPFKNERIDAPTYYSNIKITTVAINEKSRVYKEQRIEDVRTLAGQVVTLSFWACSSSKSPISVEFIQNFGDSETKEVNKIGVQKIELDSLWKKYTVTTLIPSVANKVIGDSSYLAVRFWIIANDSWKSRTDGLGQCYADIDLGHIQLEFGNYATDFEYRSVGHELFMCKRTCEVGVFNLQGYTNYSQDVGGSIHFSATKRIIPAIILIHNNGKNVDETPIAYLPNKEGFSIKERTLDPSGDQFFYTVSWLADSDI